MPCDTPPPPSPVEDVVTEGNDEELDDSMYDFIEDADDLEIVDDAFEDNSTVTFIGHKEPVFCCNFDKTGQYVVTGGQDDTAYVWNVVNSSIKFECKGHSESVIAASFSSDSKYVATSDMNGLIQVWDVANHVVIWNFEIAEVTWLQWLKGTNILFAGSSDGNCWKWSIPEEDSNVFANPSASCTTGHVSHNDELLATGYSDGTLKFWNITSNTLLTTLTGSIGHKAAITTIKFNVDDSLILIASEDGTAKLIKGSDYKVLWTINGCENNEHEHENVSVEDVGFCHSLPYIAIGTNCGILTIWDVNTKMKRTHFDFHCSIIKFFCDEFAPIIYVATSEGVLQAVDTRNGDAVKYWHGHKDGILDLAISSDRSLFLTASEDHTCKIFERGIF